MAKVLELKGTWALSHDSLQWILVYWPRRGDRRGVSFVSSTRDILERCMREKGVPPDTIRELTAGLPETFAQWKAGRGL
jgi:hypothetical protein